MTHLCGEITATMPIGRGCVQFLDHGGLTFSQMHRQIEGNSSIVF